MPICFNALGMEQIFRDDMFFYWMSLTFVSSFCRLLFFFGTSSSISSERETQARLPKICSTSSV